MKAADVASAHGYQIIFWIQQKGRKNKHGEHEALWPCFVHTVSCQDVSAIQAKALCTHYNWLLKYHHKHKRAYVLLLACCLIDRQLAIYC